MAMQVSPKAPIALQEFVQIVAGEEKFTAPLLPIKTVAAEINESRFAIDQGNNHVICYKRSPSGNIFMFPLQRKIIV